jgi:purine-nucleoside phosphorylase
MTNAEKSLAVIRERIGDANVDIGFILGSGIGHLADAVEGEAFNYRDLHGFPEGNVSGHNHKLVIGTLEGVRVAIFGGRAHYYENGVADAMRVPLEVLKALGASRLFVTNAAGSFRSDIPPGDLMLIRDHINFSGRSPLIGEATDRRFVNLVDAYNPDMRAALTRVAADAGIDLQDGVYAWYSGPNFETPAEIKALHILGADAVGMSTVPEVILGRFMGLECVAVSVITNMAAGMGNEVISHEHTKAMAPIGAAKLEQVICGYLKTLAA